MILDVIIMLFVVHLILFLWNPLFFLWVILGGYMALAFAFYDMMLSTVGKDKVSEMRRNMIK